MPVPITDLIVAAVSKMVDEHFGYASATYPTVKSISECIRTIY